MRRILFGFVALATGISPMVTRAVAQESVSIQVIPAYAPHGPISPNWSDYVVNSIVALEGEAPVVGDRNLDPAGYEAVSGPVSPLDMMYTNYNSWLGMAAPSDAFANLPAEFQAEYGNRIHFGLHIITDGSVTFKLDELEWKLDSNDITDYFDQEGTFAGASYSTTRVGIDFGLDGIKGGGDDIVYDNGEAGTTPVHELMYVGVGDGFLSDEPGAIDDQDDINTTFRDLMLGCVGGCVYDLQAIYSLPHPDAPGPLVGAGGVQIEMIPGFGGDFDHDRNITSADKDMLTTAIVSGGNDILYDLDANGSVDFTDLEIMVHDIANTYFGDANCDGEFDSEDLIEVFVAGKYETAASAVWSEGDFTADGVFDSSDLVVAMIDGGYDQGPRPAVAVVPEPASAILALLGMGLLALRRR